VHLHSACILASIHEQDWKGQQMLPTLSLGAYIRHDTVAESRRFGGSYEWKHKVEDKNAI
jgi:hypothetical protein